MPALLVVGLCFAINMVDGMDVVIMSYIAPALARDWGIAPDAMGVVFSAGLVGMAIGGIFIAPLADRMGRRKIILAALALMSAGMIASGFAADRAGLRPSFCACAARSGRTAHVSGNMTTVASPATSSRCFHP